MDCIELSVYCCHLVQSTTHSLLYFSINGLTKPMPFVWDYDTDWWELLFQLAFYDNLENYIILEKLPRLLISWRIHLVASYLTAAEAGIAMKLQKFTLCAHFRAFLGIPCH